MAVFTVDKRKELSQKGQAMPDGGYPIRNASDLQNAIQAFGRANNKPEVKTWIKKRAKELNLEKMLPESWSSAEQSAIDNSNELYHHGIIGMKWKQHRLKTATNEYKSAKAEYDAKKNRVSHDESFDLWEKKYNAKNKMNKAQSSFKKNYSTYTNDLVRKADKRVSEKGGTMESALKHEVGKKAAVGALKVVGTIGTATLLIRLNKKYGLTG